MKKRIEAAEVQKQDVIIAIDISGGKINFDHLKAMVETFKIMVENYNYFGHVLLCDDEIRAEFDIEDIEDMTKLAITGGNTADYRPVFEYAKEKEEKHGWNMFKIYYLTDGYGLFPGMTEFDTIWVAGKNHGDFPFGELALIDL